MSLLSLTVVRQYRQLRVAATAAGAWAARAASVANSRVYNMDFWSRFRPRLASACWARQLYKVCISFSLNFLVASQLPCIENFWIQQVPVRGKFQQLFLEFADKLLLIGVHCLDNLAQLRSDIPWLPPKVAKWMPISRSRWLGCPLRKKTRTSALGAPNCGKAIWANTPRRCTYESAACLAASWSAWQGSNAFIYCRQKHLEILWSYVRSYCLIFLLSSSSARLHCKKHWNELRHGAA